MGIMNKIYAALCCGAKTNVVTPQKLQEEKGSLNGLVIANAGADEAGYTVVNLQAAGAATPPKNTIEKFTVLAEIHPQLVAEGKINSHGIPTPPKPVPFAAHVAQKSPANSANSVNEFDAVKRAEPLLGAEGATRTPPAALLKAASSGTASVVVNRYKEREQRNINVQIPVPQGGRVIMASTASSLMSDRGVTSGASTPVIQSLTSSVDTARLNSLFATLKTRQELVDNGLPPVPPLRKKAPAVAPRPASRTVAGDLIASAPAAPAAPPPAPPIPAGGIQPIKPPRTQTITITVKEQGNNVKAYVHPSTGNAIFANVNIAELRANLRKVNSGTESK